MMQRSRGFESRPLRFRKPRTASRSPANVAGFWRLSGEFGGKAGANSTTLHQRMDRDGRGGAGLIVRPLGWLPPTGAPRGFGDRSCSRLPCRCPQVVGPYHDRDDDLPPHKLGERPREEPPDEPDGTDKTTRRRPRATRPIVTCHHILRSGDSSSAAERVQVVPLEGFALEDGVPVLSQQKGAFFAVRPHPPSSRSHFLTGTLPRGE
jgi:hypothetical protein